MLFAWLAEVLGVSAMIGGFAAGLALSKQASRIIKLPATVHQRFRKRVHKALQPIISLFTPAYC